MTSFKRWFGAGAIVLVALALIACPSMFPTVEKKIGNMEFGAVDSTPKTVSPLGDYFKARDDATYAASSSNTKVVTASVTATTLTVTAEGPGTAIVTVTAKDRDGTVAQTFGATVAAPPSNDPPSSKTIPDASLQVGKTKMLTLSRYFTDPEGDTLEYTAESSDDDVATVTEPDADSTMITITAVAAGDAIITVTASDGTNAAVQTMFDVTVTEDAPANERPTLRRIIPDVALLVDGTKMVTLSDFYWDADDDTLTYTADSSDEATATVTEPDADSTMITITAVAAGEAMIKVTASDGKSTPRPATFMVTVTVEPTINTPPSTITGLTTDVSLEVEGVKNLTLSIYFTDLEDTLTYTAESSDDEVATVTEPDDDSMITITAAGIGDATITVTASDGKTNDGVMNASASLEFTVKVSAVNEPPTVEPISDKSLEVEGTTDLTLSDFFTDLEDTLTYTADSSNDEVATVTDPDADSTMITITAAGIGDATITVTASDGTNDAVRTTFDVSVTAKTTTPNKPPQKKVGMELPDLRRAAGASSEVIDLSKYFEDPEGYPLSYNADVVEEEPATEGESVVEIIEHASGSLPDGSDFDSMLEIEIENAGTATIEITVIDGHGQRDSDSFMITVGAANFAPIPQGTIPAQDDTHPDSRMKIEESRTVIDGDAISTYFLEVDFQSRPDEVLTFTVKHFATGTTASQAVAANAMPLAPEKVGVSASVMPTTAAADDVELTLSLTGEKGSVITDPVDPNAVPGHVVALIATDYYGESSAIVFPVRVNNRPMIKDATDRRTELEKSYRSLVANRSLPETSTPTVVPLTGTDGYFSDEDGIEIITCLYVPTPETKAAAELELTGVELMITPTKIGTMTAAISCSDLMGEKSPSYTLSIGVTAYTGSQQ